MESNQEVFITGATSNLGLYIVKTILELESSYFKLRLLIRNKEQEKKVQKILGEDMYIRLNFVVGDLTDIDFLVLAMKGCKYVIHAGHPND